MSVNERLAEAGLLGAFDRAIADRDRVAFADVLHSIGFDAAAIEKTWQWIWHSPHSPYNVDEPRLDGDLIRDSRITAVDDRTKGIIQHLFDSAGGLGEQRCHWRDCQQHALRGFAYCPYCAHVHLNIQTLGTRT